MAEYFKIILELIFDKVTSRAEITCDSEDVWSHVEIAYNHVSIWSCDHVIIKTGQSMSKNRPKYR